MRTILLSLTLIITFGLFFLSCSKTEAPSNNNTLKGSFDSPCLPPALTNGVLAFYPFSNGSLKDFSGNNHDLTNTTTAHASMDRSGNPGCAFEFKNDGAVAEFLTNSQTTFLNGLSQYSISLWYQPLDTNVIASKYQVLVCRDTSGPLIQNEGYGQWSVALFDCRKAVFGRQNSVWDKHIVPNYNCDNEVKFRTGKWAHLVATFDNAGDVLAIYRNGVLQNTVSGIDSSFNIPSPYADIGDLFMGINYTGRLDDVILYNRVLSQAEITQLSQLGGCCSE